MSNGNGTETNGKADLPTTTSTTTTTSTISSPNPATTPTTSASSTPSISTPSISSTESNGTIIEWGSRTVEIFERLEQVGAGTYGQVFKARNKLTGEVVALKRVRMDQEKEGLPITAIREIKILKELRHENIITLKEIVTSKDYDKGKGSIYLVFEYMDHDLTGLMDSSYSDYFTEAQIKCYMKQLLEGLFFCHKKNVLHRDVKGANLLINNKGILKLADFGLARFFNDTLKVPYTNRVITLWYRPPELLFGSQNYGPAVDMWSAGCILAELLSKKPIFPGKDEVQQLEYIWKLCGSPTEENWPDAHEYPLWNMLKPQRVFKRRLREVFKHFPEAGLDLLDKMLTLDPKKRIDAEKALDHDFFWTDPMPASPRSLPRYESCHELSSKKRKQAQQQQQEQANKRMRPDGPGGPGVLGGPPPGARPNYPSGHHPQPYPPHQYPHHAPHHPHHPHPHGQTHPHSHAQQHPPYPHNSHHPHPHGQTHPHPHPSAHPHAPHPGSSSSRGSGYPPSGSSGSGGYRGPSSQHHPHPHPHSHSAHPHTQPPHHPAPHSSHSSHSSHPSHPSHPSHASHSSHSSSHHPPPSSHHPRGPSGAPEDSSRSHSHGPSAHSGHHSGSTAATNNPWGQHPSSAPSHPSSSSSSSSSSGSSRPPASAPSHPPSGPPR